MTRALLLLAVLASAAHADVWQRAIDPDAGVDVYDTLMTKGDDAAIAANSASISLQQTRDHIKISVDAYRAAAKARPTSGEPWFRIGTLLNSFFFDDCDTPQHLLPHPQPKTCSIRGAEKYKRAEETLEAWDKFEALAPLDPRLNGMLIQRAILRTKLVASLPGNSKSLLESAAKDYQTFLDREDGVSFAANGGSGRLLALGNLAETHMMLGNLDISIDTYLQTIRLGADNPTIYGLAVALDRNERHSDAMYVIRSLGVDAYTDFQKRLAVGRIFFVPNGEEEYYFALCDEALGNIDGAIDHWKAFVVSGVHPMYQPRAKEHLDRLLALKNMRWKVPLTEDGPFRRRRP